MNRTLSRALILITLASVLAIPTMVSAQWGVSVEVKGDTIVLTDPDGIGWSGPSDLPCGYGLDIHLPGGSVICFNYNADTVAIRDLDPADQRLIDDILAQVPNWGFLDDWTNQPTPVAETESPTATPEPPATGTGSFSSNNTATPLAVAIIAALIAITAAGALALRKH